MNYDPSLVARFETIRESDESISWVGRPHFVPYLFSGLPLLVIGCCWGAFDLQLILHAKSISLGFALPFFALHLFPFWGSLLYMGWLLLSFHNVAYAISNKRLLLRSGAFGPSFKCINLASASNIQVSKGPIEGMVGAGSIQFTYGSQPTGSMMAPARPVTDRFRAIDDPYDVYKQINDAIDALTAKTRAAEAGN
jgi:hypothetical protein